MWTKITQVYTTPHAQNCWAYADVTKKWHKVANTSTDGTSNVFLLLATAQASGRQAYLVTDSAGTVTGAYL
jgi:hypothetical protein